jgi:RNA polymerase sigma-70 factor, ECF subfamily
MAPTLPVPAHAAAFEQLYREQRECVFAICLRLCGDRVRASELQQDVFVRIWEQWGRLDATGDTRAWVRRVAVNTVFNVTRSDRRRLMRVALTDDLGSAVPERALASSVPFATPAPVRRLAIERAMTALTGRAREVFVLHDIEGHTTEEIAALLRTAPSTVRVHLARARAVLREALTR